MDEATEAEKAAARATAEDKLPDPCCGNCHFYFPDPQKFASGECHSIGPTPIKVGEIIVKTDKTSTTKAVVLGYFGPTESHILCGLHPMFGLYVKRMRAAAKAAYEAAERQKAEDEAAGRA